MNGSIAQASQMQEKGKTELEINTVTQILSFCKLRMECKTMFQWFSAEFKSLQVSSLYFKLINHNPLNFDLSFLFGCFYYINITTTNLGFWKFSNMLLHLLYGYALTDSCLHSCYYQLRNSSGRCWNCSDVIAQLSPWILLSNFWNSFFLCAWIIANMLHANTEIILFFIVWKS